MSVLNLGGIITSLSVPDARGRSADFVLGHDDPRRYLDASPYRSKTVFAFGLATS